MSAILLLRHARKHIEEHLWESRDLLRDPMVKETLKSIATINMLLWRETHEAKTERHPAQPLP